MSLKLYCEIEANQIYSISYFNHLDINECQNATLNDCHANANCTNTEASFMCECNVGYTGNGSFCEGKFR